MINEYVKKKQLYNKRIFLLLKTGLWSHILGLKKFYLLNFRIEYTIKFAAAGVKQWKEE